MITKLDLQERVREWSLREDVVEKDYVLGWVLWGIGANPVLGKSWVFKGGTSLKKCYFETYRFSEDLDFTLLPGSPQSEADLRPILGDILREVADASGIDFSGRAPMIKNHSSGNYTEGRIYYTGPRRSPQVASIKLDLSASERVVRTPVRRLIAHPFPDSLPDPADVLCYAPEEVFAEKIRAMGERSRPRDLYDIVNLFRRPEFTSAPRIIREALEDKCSTKGVPFPALEAISNSEARLELESEGENMLGHQLPALPPLESFWSQLKALFDWLMEVSVEPALARASWQTEDSGTHWTAPPSVASWGFGVPLERVRFAGANRLCIIVGYQGSIRTVEPYSLRRTQDGNLLLHAVRSDNGEHRAYRVDRIQSIEITNHPFKPRYIVEFSTSGPLSALAGS